MPFYNIISPGSRTVIKGCVEASKNGTIKAVTASHAWMLGKAVPTANEWLHRHQMQLEPIRAQEDIDRVRALLNPTASLPGMENPK